eukprot:m.526924 g.526924  ORF g.526924 m.526924 type:complete len:90 (-) comp22007_c0_seq7:344-613(-)
MFGLQKLRILHIGLYLAIPLQSSTLHGIEYDYCTGGAEKGTDLLPDFLLRSVAGDVPRLSYDDAAAQQQIRRGQPTVLHKLFALIHNGC